jgi:hypothetical protein
VDVPLTIRALVAVSLAVGVASLARAEGLPRAVALPPHTQQAARDAALSRELERALIQQGKVELLPQPALDLEAVQLAIDCVEETPACLGQVARRIEAEIVIAPSVQRTPNGIVLGLLYFDARSGKPPRKVAYKQAGEELGRQTFDALPGLLRQLFPEEEAATEPEASEPTTAGEETAAPVSAESGGARKLPLGPIVLGGVGVAALATGVVFGAMMNSTENSYAARPIQDEAQVQSAEDERKRGESQALVANVALGVGAAAIVAAGVWLALELTADQEPPQAALVPALGTDYAGLTVVGTLGARE